MRRKKQYIESYKKYHKADYPNPESLTSEEMADINNRARYAYRKFKEMEHNAEKNNPYVTKLAKSNFTKKEMKKLLTDYCQQHGVIISGYDRKIIRWYIRRALKLRRLNH